MKQMKNSSVGKHHSRCAICGGSTFKKREQLGLLAGDKLFVLADLAIAQCDTCGERYHPLETARRIHNEIQQRLRAGDVSPKDVSKLSYVHEPELHFVQKSQHLENRLARIERALKELSHAKP